MASVMQINDLVAEWQRRYELGEYISADELCSDCPELIPEVERRIEEVEHSPAFVTHGAEDGSAVVTMMQTDSTGESPETLIFHQRYNKLRFLARGGLGEIYIADNLELQRDVVLKFIRAKHRHRAECQAQFQLEAEVTAKLDHPGVVPVYGIGRTPDGRPCYAMRFIHGVTLDETIAKFHSPRDDSPFSTARTSELHSLLSRFITTCKTLAYAHNRGIVHRDIKPDNIMLGKYGETLVVDWGLALPVDRDDSAKASGEETLMPSSGTGSSSGSTGGPVGTPAYMSPEQANGAVVRPASDIFSLGATLYKLLTGHAPYSGESVHDVVTKARYGSFTPLRQLDRRIPRPLAAICQKALAVDPAQRYLTALEFADDLERCLADDPVVAYREGFSERIGRWTRRHRVWTQAILTVLVVVSLVVTLSALMLQRSAHNEREARTSAESTQKDSLQLAAEFVAKAVGQDLQSRWLILEREAADSELSARLRVLESEQADPALGDRDLQLWLSDRMSQYESIAPARSWSVFDHQGICRGRYPKSDIIGKSFAFRDYFHGRGRDFDPDQKQLVTPITRPHRSNVFRSKTDDAALVVTLSVPIWSDRTNERRVIGIVTTSLQIGQFGILESQLGGDRVLRLVDTNASELNERGTVLYDSRSQNGTLSQTSQRIPDSLVQELEQLRLSRVQQRRQQLDTVGFLKEDFVEEVVGKGSNRWVAAFEPVILRTESHEWHDTGWVVVVQQPTSIRD